MTPIQHSLPLARLRLLTIALLLLSLILPLGAVVLKSDTPTAQKTSDILIVDAQDSREQALSASVAPKSVIDQQQLIDVRYWGMDGKEHKGQLVCDTKVAADLIAIFHEIDSARFPIQSVIPIVHFHWDDDESIARNNTSAFNYRLVSGTHHLSKHAFGTAIDINPYLNPWVGHNGKAQRPYKPNTPGTICEGGVVVRAFRKRGWTWGGHWKGAKDYQHFDKR